MVEYAGPNVASALRGRGGLRSAMAHAYYMATGQAPGQNPLSEAMAVLEGMAMVTQRERVAVRVADDDNGRLVIDLARSDGKAVVVDGSGWDVVERSPVLFRSTEVIGELPIPVVGGSLDDLTGLVNVAEDDRPVLVGCLVAALFPDLAHPIPFFNGEQGTAKSWASRLFVRTFDGVDADVQGVPRNLDDWSVLASASWSVALDNVTGIPPWFSDALCRAVTGARTLKRALYTDDGVTVLRVKRVVALNGIDPEIAGGDLAERLVRFDLEPVQGRVTDEEIAAAFAAADGRILGALLDVTARVLARLPTTEVTDPPRTASFARVLAATDDVLDTKGLDRYRVMVETQVAQAMEASVFCQALERMVPAEWSGTASELIELLRRDDRTGRDDLPKTPQAVGSSLSRAAPSLRARGWQARPTKSGSKRRWDLVNPRMKGNYGDLAVPSVPSVPMSGGSWDGRDGRDGPGSLVPLYTSEDRDPDPKDDAERWHGDDPEDE